MRQISRTLRQQHQASRGRPETVRIATNRLSRQPARHTSSRAEPRVTHHRQQIEREQTHLSIYASSFIVQHQITQERRTSSTDEAFHLPHPAFFVVRNRPLPDYQVMNIFAQDMCRSSAVGLGGDNEPEQAHSATPKTNTKSPLARAQSKKQHIQWRKTRRRQTQEQRRHFLQPGLFHRPLFAAAPGASRTRAFLFAWGHTAFVSISIKGVVPARGPRWHLNRTFEAGAIKWHPREKSRPRAPPSPWDDACFHQAPPNGGEQESYMCPLPRPRAQRRRRPAREGAAVRVSISWLTTRPRRRPGSAGTAAFHINGVQNGRTRLTGLPLLLHDLSTPSAGGGKALQAT